MEKIRKNEIKARARRSNILRMTLSLLFACILLLGSVLPAYATTGYPESERTQARLTAISDRMRSRSTDARESANPNTAKGKNSADALKQAKKLMNQKLAVSNRLVLDVGAMKKKTGKLADAAKNRIRQILKNSDKLSGDQIVALKDVVSQIKQYRDNVEAQERVVTEILGRLQGLRTAGKYSEAAAVVDELIAAQKKMIGIMKGSGTAITHIGTILKY
jgi:hypothetical protein